MNQSRTHTRAYIYIYTSISNFAMVNSFVCISFTLPLIKSTTRNRLSYDSSVYFAKYACGNNHMLYAMGVNSLKITAAPICASVTISRRIEANQRAVGAHLCLCIYYLLFGI